MIHTVLKLTGLFLELFHAAVQMLCSLLQLVHATGEAPGLLLELRQPSLERGRPCIHLANARLEISRTIRQRIQSLPKCPGAPGQLVHPLDQGWTTAL